MLAQVELFSCLSKTQGVFWAKDLMFKLASNENRQYRFMAEIAPFVFHRSPSLTGANTTIIALPE